jgi:hypothetical protein
MGASGIDDGICGRGGGGGGGARWRDKRHLRLSARPQQALVVAEKAYILAQRAVYLTPDRKPQPFSIYIIDVALVIYGYPGPIASIK